MTTTLADLKNLFTELWQEDESVPQWKYVDTYVLRAWLLYCNGEASPSEMDSRPTSCKVNIGKGGYVYVHPEDRDKIPTSIKRLGDKETCWKQFLCIIQSIFRNDHKLRDVIGEFDYQLVYDKFNSIFNGHNSSLEIEKEDIKKYRIDSLTDFLVAYHIFHNDAGGKCSVSLNLPFLDLDIIEYQSQSISQCLLKINNNEDFKKLFVNMGRRSIAVLVLPNDDEVYENGDALDKEDFIDFYKRHDSEANALRNLQITIAARIHGIYTAFGLDRITEKTKVFMHCKYGIRRAAGISLETHIVTIQGSKEIFFEPDNKDDNLKMRCAIIKVATDNPEDPKDLEELLESIIESKDLSENEKKNVWESNLELRDIPGKFRQFAASRRGNGKYYTSMVLYWNEHRISLLPSRLLEPPK